MNPKCRRYSVSLTEQWDLQVAIGLLITDNIASTDRRKLVKILKFSDDLGHIEVTYRFSHGKIVRTPAYTRVSEQTKRMCGHKYMEFFLVTLPDGNSFDLHTPRTMSPARLNSIAAKISLQLRSVRASGISPYTQGVCAFCMSSIDLKRCTGCSIVQYCSSGHQREHWKDSHRQECRTFRRQMHEHVAPLPHHTRG